MNAIICSTNLSMDNKQKHLKMELIKTAEAIRKKYKDLHNDRLVVEEQMEERYKPITTSLKSVLSAQADTKTKNKSNFDDFDYDDEYEDKTEEEEIESDYNDNNNKKDFQTPKKLNVIPRKLNFDTDSLKQEPTSARSGNENTTDLSKYFDNLLSRNSDPQYGIRRARGILKIGNFAVQLDEKTLTIGSKTVKHTDGLLNLLFYKIPEGYTKSDLRNYKQILLLTNAHKKRFNVKSPIRTSKKSYKYKAIIKPLFHIGSGLQTEYMIANSNLVDYSYWDDPNELVDRLRLLVSSTSAGHTGHNNEIISIIEELREARIIE